MKALKRSIAHALALGTMMFTVASSPAMSQEARMNQALQDGRALAKERSAEAGKGIKTPAEGKGAAAVVPHYNDAADGRYQGGKGNPAPAGTQKILDCATATPEQLAGFAGKHCDATNFLTRNSNTRPSVAIGKNDPLRTGAQGKVDLGKQLGLPSGMTNTTNEAPQCETVIKPGGEKVATAVCHEEGQTREEKCLVGRVIEVNGEFRYECETQVKRIKQVQCDITYGEECTTAPSTQVCPDGSKPANGICTSLSTEERPADVSGHKCGDGYTLSGTSCVRVESQPATVSGYSCPDGYVSSGNRCVKTTTETISGTPILSCPVGSVLSGDQCLSTQTINATISGYNCPSGYVVSGSSCVLTETVPPTVNNSCPSGYSFSGGSCVKTTTVAGQAQFTCSAGYTQSGNQCTRQVSTAATITGYSCPSGYTSSGSSCTRTITDTISGTPVYTCTSGYTYNGSACVKQSTTLPSTVWVCPPGGALDSKGTGCTFTTTTAAGINYTCDTGYTWKKNTRINGVLMPGGYCQMPLPRTCGYRQSSTVCPSWYADISPYAPNLNGLYKENNCEWWPMGFCYSVTYSRIFAGYNCPTGTILVGTSCVQTTTQPAQNGGFSCPSGYALRSTEIGDICVKTETTDRILSGYTCPSGYVVSGSQCVKTTTETISGTPVLSCPSGGVLSGDQCLSTQTISATISGYTCPSGYANSGSSCVLTETVPPTVNNSCPSGYNLSGGTCIKTTTVAGQAQFSCALGYTLSGNQCTRQVSNAATITGYSCPSGYTSSGSSCTRTLTSSIGGTAIYTCSAGFDLSGNTCTKTTTIAATPIYSCQPGGTLTGDRCTYIVTTTSDAIEKFSCDDPMARLTAGVLQAGRQTYVCCKETVNNQCGGLEVLLK